MAEALNVLCLSTDPATSREVIRLLAQLPGYTATVQEVDYETGTVDLRELRDPQLVIVVLGIDPQPGLAVIEEVHRAMPAAQLLALAPEENPETIIHAMRAGADEFLPLPVDANGLLKVCIKVSALRASTVTARGEVWVVHGPKGGVGVTTLVANLGFALRAAQRVTALVDLDIHGGDLAVLLNVTPVYSLRDVVTNFKRLDSVFLQGAMIRHASGLELLAAPLPTANELAVTLTAEQTLRVLELLDGTHQVTLVDTSSVPLDSTRAALGCADRILLVTELTLPGLRACARTLEMLRSEDVDAASTVELVIGKYAGKSWEVAPSEASRSLGLPVRALIPRDDAAVYTAINSGLPLDQVRGGTAVQRAIAGLVGTAAAPDEQSTVLKGFRRLFSGAERRV